MRPLVPALLVLAILSGAARAQECGPLKEAISLNLADEGSRFTVPVTVNGAPKHFLLDTGGAFTQISMETVKAMNLTVLPSRFEMYDMYGNKSPGQVIVDIAVGPLTAARNETLISSLGGMDGIFAPDFMQNYDIEIDFAARKLNYFLTDHCDGHVIYWPHGVVAVVPFHGWNAHSKSQMSVPVTLDGHEMTAVVDTGAGNSTLDASTAHALFDLGPDSPGAVPLGTMGSDSHKVFGYTFKMLSIGGITINNPRLAVVPELMGKKTKDDIAADSHIRVRRELENMEPTMLIGMNTLRKLHLYIAFKEQKLYITAGSDQTTQKAPVEQPGKP